MYVKYRINIRLFLRAQRMSTNSVLTPCKQGAVLSRYYYCYFPTPNFYGYSITDNAPITQRQSTHPSPPRNITHANPRLLQIAANVQLGDCCEMLTRFGFRRKMLYLCTSEEEKARNTGFSPIFLPNIKDVLHRK